MREGLSAATADLLATIGSNVRRLRAGQELSVVRLAEMAEVHRVNVTRIEAGELNITMETLARLAKALSVTPEELVKPAL